MKKQLLRYALLSLMIISVVPWTFAIEKASDSDVKKSQIIVLNSYAIAGEVSTKENETVPVVILGFQTDRWFILINHENKTVLEGYFLLDSAYRSDGDPSFSGSGINEITGQKLNFDCNAYNDGCTLSFSCVDKDQKIELPFSIYLVQNDIPWTSVLLGSSRSFADLMSGDMKTATLKQLKKCLLQNPYLRKL